MSTNKVDARGALEAWACTAMEMVTHVAELHARASRYNTETLRCAMLAKKGELRAFLSTQPEGYVLGPVEPTGAMGSAGFRAVEDGAGVACVYKAMIAAAQEGK